jgi:1-deoxy-D-xylulose-5-phosphate synthase
VHVLTQKGRGYAPAENDPIKNMHDMGGLKPGSYTAAFSEGLIKLADEHNDVVALTAAMPDSTGLLPFRERFPERCIDVGIAEQHAVTSAAGMAMGGLRPVVAIYSTFLSRAFDQVNLDVGLHGQPVIFCLDRAGVTGDDGPSHHGLLDMVLLSKIPDMAIFAPSSYQELQTMLTEAYAYTDGPSAIRWTKTAAPSVSEHEVGHGFAGRKVKSGTQVCLIGVGKMLSVASEAAELLEADGIDATVWDPRLVKPLDPEMLADAAQHPLVVTIEDGLADGGAGASIRAAIGDSSPTTAVRVLGVPTRYVPHGNATAILASLGLDAPSVADTVREALG